MFQRNKNHKKTSPPKVEEVASSINKACREMGSKYSDYSCKYVSWDDVQRGTVSGGLSCWGGNITDTYLKAKNGQKLFTVRSDNWNEKLGHISSDKIAVVVGNTTPGGEQLRPITLRSFLKNMPEFGKYCKVPDRTDLSDEELDKKVSIRFQTTFLPITNDDRGTMEFCTEAYNYNTMSDDNPRNLVVLATTQGVAIQQDGSGAKKLMHHGVDYNGNASKYWLEAERSEHKVGGEQKETQEEREDAMKRGKATASVIGIPAMGTRFNALLTIQIPLQQKQQQPQRQNSNGFFSALNSLFAPTPSFYNYSNLAPPPPCPPMAMASSSSLLCCDMLEPQEECCDAFCEVSESATENALFCCENEDDDDSDEDDSWGEEGKNGVANAARVSRGTKAGAYKGLSVKSLKRDPSQHITVTIVFYNTIKGGVPSKRDVVAAIDDMEELYKACNWSGHLADQEADFMKEELKVKDLIDLSTKIEQQPYSHQPIANYNIFPTDD